MCMHICIQDECSFVSLRDVERAMIVFEWFYENNESFEKFLKKVAGYKVCMLTRSLHIIKYDST